MYFIKIKIHFEEIERVKFDMKNQVRAETCRRYIIWLNIIKNTLYSI